MTKKDYLIVGGGIAGTIAAEFIRMNDPAGSITIVMEEPERLYSRVMLPYYLRDKIPFERLYVRNQKHYEEKNIQLLKGIRVGKVNTQNKTISLFDKEEIGYNKLLIASGGKVNRLSIPGNDLNGVTYLRTTSDVKNVKDLMNKAKSGVVIGGGFIGFEYAQSFVHAGLETTCIIIEPYFWNHLVGENSGKLINKILEKNGVEVINNSEVSEFVGDGSLSSVKLKNGREVSADVAGVGVGIHMELSHLKDSGLDINKGVVTNEFLETNTQDVWAAGDIAEFRDVLFDKHHLMGNWSSAAAQGKVVGPNMVAGWSDKSGGKREQFVTVSAYTIPIFDGTFTFLGDSEVSKDTELVERGSIEEGKLVQIHIRHDSVVGASLINSPADRSPISELIKSRKKIGVGIGKLADTNFSLKNLISN